MRPRFLIPFCAIILLLGFLTITRSQGGIVVPTGRNNVGVSAFSDQKTKNYIAPAIAEKKDRASGVYRTGRRIQAPVTLHERHPGYTYLPGSALEWKVRELCHGVVFADRSGAVFLDRIRILLYPKHSFW